MIETEFIFSLSASQTTPFYPFPLTLYDSGGLVSSSCRAFLPCQASFTLSQYELAREGHMTHVAIPDAPLPVEPHQTLEKQDSKIHKLYFYAAHTLYTTSDRLVEFTTILSLATAFPNSLVEIGILSFIVNASTIPTTTFTSKWITQKSMYNYPSTYWRFNKIIITLIIMKTSIIITYITLIPLISNSSYILFSIVCLFMSTFKVASTAYTLAMERDWVVLINHTSKQLTNTNANMRRIDLIVQIIAPLIVGALGSIKNGTLVQITFILAWTTITTPIEWILLKKVCLAYPDLWTDGWLQDSENVWKTIRKDVVLYWRHPLLLCSLTMAWLYLTVLSFDGVLITYLRWIGFSDAVLAAIRGVSVLSGLIGTLIMPFLSYRIGLERTGLWSLSFQWLTLSMAVCSFYAGTDLTSSLLLFIGVIASRAGLWSFDLSQMQILQTHLEPTSRESSVVNGTQTILCSVFQLFSSVLVVVLGDPSQFVWGAWVSFGSVAVALVLYSAWVWKERGHLLHPEKIPFLRSA